MLFFSKICLAAVNFFVCEVPLSNLRNNLFSFSILASVNDRD